MRVLVCGGRNYEDAERVVAVLDKLHNTGEGIDVLIEGGARGADRLGRRWAQAEPVRVETYEAEWEHHGKFAGHLRNQRMVDEGKPDLVIAFPGGRGTADMVKKAHKAGVKVIEIAEAS